MAPYDEYPDDRGFRYLIAFVYSIVVAILWIPAAVVRRAKRSFKQFGAESWPRANGAVTAVNVKVIHGWVVDYAIGQLDYSYRLAGQYYAGNTSWQFPDEQAAWSFVDARRDKPVIVRYKDNNAEASVLIEADQPPGWGEISDPSFFSMVWHHWRDEIGEIEEPNQSGKASRPE